MNLNHLIEKAFLAPKDVIEHFQKFVMEHPDSFNLRSNPLGHVTCSMLVLNEDRTKVLLTHHKKFDIWLQLGGHWDNGVETALQTALRETSEEGYGEKDIICDVFLNGLPFDLDAHPVKDPKGDHTHYDICFACIVKDDYPIEVSHESHDVGWFEIDKIVDTELVNERLNRLLKKSKQLSRGSVPYHVSLK